MKLTRYLGILNTLFLRGMGSGVSVILTIFISRYLSTNTAAHFFLLFNSSIMASVCFRWGLDEVIIRRIASASKDNVPNLARYLIKTSHTRVATWAIPSITFSLALLHPDIRLSLYGLTTTEALVAIFASTLIALSACASRVQQGLGRTNHAVFFLNIFVPLLSLVGLLALTTVGVTVSALDLIILYFGISAVAYVYVVSAEYGLPLAILRSSSDAIDAAQDRHAANKLGGVVMAQQALNWGAMLVVPLAYGSEVYKGFVVTQKLALLISLVMLAINFTYSSQFAALYSARQFSKLRRLVKLSIQLVIIASAAAVVAVILLQSMLFNFSKVDISMSTTLGVLLLSQVLFSLASVYSVVLSMCREENFLLLAQGISSIIGFLLFLILSKLTKIEIACGAFVVTYFALALILGLRVRHITTH